MVDTPSPYWVDDRGSIAPAEHVTVSEEEFVMGTSLQVPILYKDGKVRDLSDSMAIVANRC